MSAAPCKCRPAAKQGDCLVQPCQSSQLPAHSGQQQDGETASSALSEQLHASVGQLRNSGSSVLSEQLPANYGQQYNRGSASSAFSEQPPAQCGQQQDGETASSALSEQLPASAVFDPGALGGAPGRGRGGTLQQPPPCSDFDCPCEDISDWISRRSKKELLDLFKSACACLKGAWAEFALSKGIAASMSKKVDAGALRTF